MATPATARVEVHTARPEGANRAGAPLAASVFVAAPPVSGATQRGGGGNKIHADGRCGV